MRLRPTTIRGVPIAFDLDRIDLALNVKMAKAVATSSVDAVLILEILLTTVMPQDSDALGGLVGSLTMPEINKLFDSLANA